MFMQVESVEFNVKVVEYKGHELYVPHYTTHMACDADGHLFAYAAQPKWNTHRNEWFPPTYEPRCERIALMVVEGVNCEHTLEAVS